MPKNCAGYGYYFCFFDNVALAGDEEEVGFEAVLDQDLTQSASISESFASVVCH